MKKVKNRFFTLTGNNDVNVTMIDLPTYNYLIRLKHTLTRTYMKVSTRNKTKTNKAKCKLKQDENVMFQIKHYCTGKSFLVHNFCY